MKVLYVKNGSERDKKFQLQTTIYEENGKRFVNKSVLCDEALPHLQNIYENYKSLSESIINPKVKLAKIIAKDERSLTFEYIDGVSLSKQLNKLEKTQEKVDIFVQEYIDFIKSSFKTTMFDSKNVSKELEKVFGSFDYSVFNGEVCFDGISNIDLIFSNIIYKDDEIYIIDYEWVFEFDLPVNYTIFRTLKYMHLLDSLGKYEIFKIYEELEKIFIEDYAYDKSFNKYNLQYGKKRVTVDELIRDKEQEVIVLSQQLQNKEQEVIVLSQQLQNKEQKVHDKSLVIYEYGKELKNKEEQLQDLLQLADSMRIKNRIKKLLGLYKT